MAAQEQALALDGDVPRKRTRQIVAFANGDHSEGACRALWEPVPETYRKCRSFSGFWKTYVGSSRREPPQRRQTAVFRTVSSFIQNVRWGEGFYKSIDSSYYWGKNNVDLI